MATQRASDFGSLKWVVSGLPEVHRVALTRNFVERVQQAPAGRRALAAAAGVDEAQVFSALNAAAANGLFATR